jgi:hypothetical protein
MPKPVLVIRVVDASDLPVGHNQLSSAVNSLATGSKNSARKI